MAFAYLSRIFGFSRDASDGSQGPTSKSESEPPPASLPSVASSGIEPAVPSQPEAESGPASESLPPDSASISDERIEVPKKSPEPDSEAGPPPASLRSVASSDDHIEPALSSQPDAKSVLGPDSPPFDTASIPNEAIEAPEDPPGPDLAESPSASASSISSSAHNHVLLSQDNTVIPNIIVKSPDESTQSNITESPSASDPFITNSRLEHVLSNQPEADISNPNVDQGLSRGAGPRPPWATDLAECSYRPGLNRSQLSLLLHSAQEPGNKSAFKQVKTFVKKATRTLRKKLSKEQLYALDHWDSPSLRGRASSINLPLSPPMRLSALSLSSPTIFVDASAHGVGFVFYDRWLAWTFTPNHPDIVLGPDRNIIMHWAELIAVELGILTLVAGGCRNTHVLVMSDNRDVVKALEKKKWTSTHGLDIILTRILDLCEKELLDLKGEWISTKENPADGPSRGEYGPDNFMFEYAPTIPQYLAGLVNQVLRKELEFEGQ